MGRVSGIVFALLIVMQIASAQTPAGRVAGVLRDPSGAVVQGGSIDCGLKLENVTGEVSLVGSADGLSMRSRVSSTAETTRRSATWVRRRSRSPHPAP